MRKWMRERMKRRGKPPEKSKVEAAQAPLQPAYFDADVPPSSPAREAQERQPIESPGEALEKGACSLRSIQHVQLAFLFLSKGKARTWP